MKNVENACNILVLGRTGVGKSSLLNYLLGQKLAETGTGRPVTGKGIFCHDGIINGNRVVIHDSWGMEAGKTEEWRKLVDQHLESHGADKELSKWMHVAIYCINAGSHRIEDIDLDMIKLLSADGLYPVVALTNADKISLENGKELIGVLHKELSQGISVIEVCSVEEKTRSGHSSPVFGYGELMKVIFRNWESTLKDKIPKRVVYLLNKEVDQMEEKLNGVAFSDFEKEFKNQSQSLFQFYYPQVLKTELENAGKTSVGLIGIFNVEVRIDDQEVQRKIAQYKEVKAKLEDWWARFLDKIRTWLFGGTGESDEAKNAILSAEEAAKENAFRELRTKINGKELQSRTREQVEKLFTL